MDRTSVSRSSLSRMVAVLGAAVLLATVPAATLAQGDFEAERTGGIPGNLLPGELVLWQYDTDTSEYVVADGDAMGEYVPDLRSLEGKRIGFAEGWAAITFSFAINQRLYELADELGFEVIYCDNNFQADQAVTCAEDIARQGPDFVVESNWQAGAAGAVMDVFNEIGVPVVTIDVIHPNAIFLGADNYTSGLIGGQAAGDYAQSLDRCADAFIYLGINPGEGDAANERLSGFADGVQTVCGAIPPDRIVEQLIDDGTTEQALNITTDWLTANPGAGFVLAATIDDARSDGIAKALAQSGREGAAVGIGCDDTGVASTRIAVEDNQFLGCVAYFPEKYPDYAVSIAADVLAGNTVPQEVHLAHVFLAQDTVDDVYPAG